MVTIKLPPASSDLILNIVVPKEIRPYLEESYLNLRKDGYETPEHFVLRQILNQSVQQKAAVTNASIQISHDAQLIADFSTISIEQTSVIVDLDGYI